MFDVLAYTDSTTAESLTGRSGFQFQSSSPDATETDRDLVQKRFLHTIGLGIDPESHPETCCYDTADDRLILSRGRSTGATIGGRPGNQFTAAILTSQELDYLPLRPAQVYSCPRWQLSSYGAKEIAPWEPPLDIDPGFEISALHEMVVADPWAQQMLPAFLTMARKAIAKDRTRLILKHPDLDVVMKWIALATLFEEGSTALRTSFRAFVADPMSANFALVGAHPLFSPNLTPASAAPLNLVDLEAQVMTSVEIDQTAAMHARWFLDGDPYSALDAIETSRRWSAHMPAEIAAAASRIACQLPVGEPAMSAGPRTVSAIDALNTDPSHVEETALLALAAAGCEDELDAYGDVLVEEIAQRIPDASAVGGLAAAGWALSAAGQEDLATAVMMTVLEQAAADPRAAAAWAANERARTAREPLTWTDPAAADHAAGLLAVVLAHAAPADLDPLLRTTSRLNTPLTSFDVQRDLDRFVEAWSANPSWCAHESEWAFGERLRAKLEVRLTARFAAGDPDALNALATGAWDGLIRPGQPLDPATRPVDAWLASRLIPAMTEADQVAAIGIVAPLVPDSAWKVFLGPPPVTPLAWDPWLSTHPQLSPDAEKHLSRVASTAFTGGDGRAFMAITGTLNARRPAGVGPDLRSLSENAATVMSQIGNAERASAEDHNRSLRKLAGLPAEWVTVYAPEIAGALLNSRDTTAMASLSSLGNAALEKAVIDATLDGVRRGDANLLAGALDLIENVPKGLGRQCREALFRLWDDAERSDTLTALGKRLHVDYQDQFHDLHRASGKGRLTRSVRRNLRGQRSGKDAG